MKHTVSLWRQILWPERKTWAVAVVGAILGAFSNLANLLLRVVHLHWLIYVGFAGAGLIGLTRCLKRVSAVPDDAKDDTSEDDKIDEVVICHACGTFRFCLFCLMALVVVSTTSIGQLATDAVAARLGLIDAKLGQISQGVAGIASELHQVKRETSDDPRKELANLGVLWTVDAFFDAIRRGDARTVTLFVAGQMSTDAADSQGRPLPVLLALNNTNAAEILGLLADAGLDIDHSYGVSGALAQQRMTLLSRAIEKGNSPLVEALIRHRVNTNVRIQTFGAMGFTRDTYPLASAIYWRQLDIARMLLIAGADPAAGDYAAYREARALREKSSGEAVAAGRLDELIKRLSPHGADAARIGNELRLQEVEQELNKVALAGLRAPPGSSERRRLDAEYAELQVERTKLQRGPNADK